MTDQDHRHVIAIDGPAAAGKTTVARLLADRLDAMLFDTGALYRTLTLAAIRTGIAPGDGDRLAGLAGSHRIDLRSPSVSDGRQADVLLNGEDVTWLIRTPEIDAAVSEVSAHPAVRTALLGIQRDIASSARVVMVGRDIGTVVIPDAGIKFYLEASAEERARRRLLELQGRGVVATYDDVLEDMRARDAHDTSRETAPLAAAPDAVIVDTDRRSIDDVVNDLERQALARWQGTEVARG
jgi:cytidylate kinase